MNFSLDESLGFIIYKTHLRLKNNLNQSFKPFDITTEQWGILGRLWEKDGVSQKELSEKTHKDQPNITRILDKLEQKGLIRRELNPGDRRAFSVFLTTEAYNLKSHLVPIAEQSLEKAFKGFNPEEIQTLKASLNRIYENLESEFLKA